MSHNIYYARRVAFSEGRRRGGGGRGTATQTAGEAVGADYLLYKTPGDNYFIAENNL